LLMSLYLVHAYDPPCFFTILPPPPRPTLFPYTTLFRSSSPILSSCLTAIGIYASYSKYNVLLPFVNSRAIPINVLTAPASGRTTLFIHSSIEIGWGVIQNRSISYSPYVSVCLKINYTKG